MRAVLYVSIGKTSHQDIDIDTLRGGGVLQTLDFYFTGHSLDQLPINCPYSKIEYVLG